MGASCAAVPGPKRLRTRSLCLAGNILYTLITRSMNASSKTFNFQACIKNVVWVPAWHEQLGHVRLLRTTAAEREERKKLDKREKKEKEEEEERYRTAYNFVKYSLGLKHQVFSLHTYS